MARSLLFGTSVSPGIAIGVLRFAHNVQTVEMRRISPREEEGEQEQRQQSQSADDRQHAACLALCQRAQTACR